MQASLGGELPFQLAFDLGGQATGPYDRVTAYLIDREGIVRQIYPMTVRSRPSSVILAKDVLALAAEQRAADAARERTEAQDRTPAEETPTDG